MPTYEYVCTACGQDVEAVQSFTDPPLTECPQCAGRLRKVFSKVGVVFKGSGFYRTDSRVAAAANAKGASKPDSDAKSAAAETTKAASASGSGGSAKSSEGSTGSSSTADSAA